jgi:hypothetical protein
LNLALGLNERIATINRWIIFSVLILFIIDFTIVALNHWVHHILVFRTLESVHIVNILWILNYCSLIWFYFNRLEFDVTIYMRCLRWVLSEFSIVTCGWTDKFISRLAVIYWIWAMWYMLCSWDLRPTNDFLWYIITTENLHLASFSSYTPCSLICLLVDHAFSNIRIVIL